MCRGLLLEFSIHLSRHLIYPKSICWTKPTPQYIPVKMDVWGFPPYTTHLGPQRGLYQIAHFCKSIRVTMKHLMGSASNLNVRNNIKDASESGIGQILPSLKKYRGGPKVRHLKAGPSSSRSLSPNSGHSQIRVTWIICQNSAILWKVPSTVWLIYIGYPACEV